MEIFALAAYLIGPMVYADDGNYIVPLTPWRLMIDRIFYHHLDKREMLKSLNLRIQSPPCLARCRAHPNSSSIVLQRQYPPSSRKIHASGDEYDLPLFW